MGQHSVRKHGRIQSCHQGNRCECAAHTLRLGGVNVVIGGQAAQPSTLDLEACKVKLLGKCPEECRSLLRCRSIPKQIHTFRFPKEQARHAQMWLLVCNVQSRVQFHFVCL